MKLVIAIVQDDDAPAVLRALVERGHRATRIASTGGFLASGNSTLLIAALDPEVEDVLVLLREHCPRRESDGRGGAIIIVSPIEHFERV